MSDALSANGIKAGVSPGLAFPPQLYSNLAYGVVVIQTQPTYQYLFQLSQWCVPAY